MPGRDENTGQTKAFTAPVSDVSEAAWPREEGGGGCQRIMTRSPRGPYTAGSRAYLAACVPPVLSGSVFTVPGRLPRWLLRFTAVYGAQQAVKCNKSGVASQCHQNNQKIKMEMPPQTPTDSQVQDGKLSQEQECLLSVQHPGWTCHQMSLGTVTAS